MCTFITGVLDRSADNPAFRALVASSDLAFEALENPHVLSQLRPGERFYRVTREQCDCATWLGTVGDADLETDEVDPRVARLRRRGWGEAKIKRWLEVTADDARKRSEADRDRGHLSIEDWATFIERALDLPEVKFVGLMMRHYDADLESAQFTFGERVRVEPDWLRDPSRRWVENRIYEFRRPFPEKRVAPAPAR